MEGLTLLVLLSTAMFFGCYLAGLIPLAVTFSEVSWYINKWLPTVPFLSVGFCRRSCDS